MSAQPSAGALRAATLIRDRFREVAAGESGRMLVSGESLARIIEAETGTAELRDALERISAGEFPLNVGPIQQMQITRQNARAALAKGAR